jgi:amino acid permease
MLYGTRNMVISVTAIIFEIASFITIISAFRENRRKIRANIPPTGKPWPTKNAGRLFVTTVIIVGATETALVVLFHTFEVLEIVVIVGVAISLTVLLFLMSRRPSEGQKVPA